MTETDLNIVAALRRGVTKAQRDIKIAAAFLIGKTDPDMHNPFWDTLANDVPGYKRDGSNPAINPEQKAEERAYQRVQSRFMNRWMTENYRPDPAALLAKILPGAIVTDITDLLRGGESGADLLRTIRDALAEADPEGFSEARRLNAQAGKCLGCGGPIDAENRCDGGGTEDYDPDADPTLRRVSETEPEKGWVPVDPEPIENKVARLRAQRDQMHAEYMETGEQDAILAFKIGQIDADIIKLTGDNSNAKGL